MTSPETPETDLPRFSSSEEVDFKTCRLAHLFRYDLGYGPVVTNRKLALGTTVHEGMEMAYTGFTIEAIEARLDELADERWAEIEAGGLSDLAEVRVDFIKDRDMAKAMVLGAIDWVRESGIDKGYETVSVEEKAYIEVPGAPCVMPIKLDLLQRDTRTERLRIVDWKTAASFSADFTKYQLAEQNGNYQLGVMALYGERPTEMAYRELRKVIPSGRTKPPYFREVRIRLTREEMLKRHRDYVATAIERFNPERPIYANPSACCGSWKNDWQAPCTKVAQGMSPLEALETSQRYAPRDSYERYLDPEE